MSVSQNYPLVQPSLSLDFANVKALDSRVTYTRASSARYYNGVTTTKAEENLVLYSQEFDNAYWTKASSTVTANATTAPDGTSTAESVLEIATNARHGIERLHTVASALDHVFSVYVKPIDRTYITLSINPQSNASAWAAAIFDMVGGTVASTNATSGLTVSASIVSVGNGWYRCVLVGNVGAVTSAYTFATSATDGTTYTAGFRGTQSFAGDVAKGFFAWGAQLEQRSSVTAYTPTTTQPITNYIPTLLTATDNVARFDHNPTTGESLGLLIEEQRTNLITYSESTWTTTRGEVFNDVIIAPDGTLSADKFVANTESNIHGARKNISGLTLGSTLTFSLFVAAAEYSKVRIADSAFSAFAVSYDLTTQTRTSFGGTGFVSSSITAVGNNWYRISLTHTVTQTSVQYSACGTPTAYDASNGIAFNGAGDGYSGIYIWGAQLEAGAFPTSYIPTVASQVTRSADAASMTGANFTSWYRADEGTLYAEASTFGTVFIVHADDGTNNNRWFTGIGTALNQTVVANGVTQAALNLGNVSPNTYAKVAFAVKTNDFSASLNGGAVSVDTSGVLPFVHRLRIGSNASPTFNGGYIRKLSYYPARLDNTQLQALTS